MIFEVGVSDMRKNECEEQSGSSSYFSYGQVCFENQTDYDLVFNYRFNELYPDMKVLITKGGRIVGQE